MFTMYMLYAEMTDVTLAKACLAYALLSLELGLAFLSSTPHRTIVFFVLQQFATFLGVFL